MPGIPLSARRTRLERGMEAIEFALLFSFLLPPFVWMFVNGMNFLRFNKATDVSRSAALLFVKGVDFTLPGNQDIISRVANGLDLQNGNTITATGVSTGSGLLIFSTIQYVGPNTCASCTNLNKYVFLDRVYVGNTNLQISGTTVSSALGNPNNTLWSATTGIVTSTLTNAGAQVASTATGSLPAAMADGQIAYLVESYFKPQGGFGSGAFDSNGVYTRVVM
jgi:hypothetical protein